MTNRGRARLDVPLETPQNDNKNPLVPDSFRSWHDFKDPNDVCLGKQTRPSVTSEVRYNKTMYLSPLNTFNSDTQDPLLEILRDQTDYPGWYVYNLSQFLVPVLPADDGIHLIPSLPPTSSYTSPVSGGIFSPGETTVSPAGSEESTMSGSTGCQVTEVDVSGYNYPRALEHLPLWEIVLKCGVVSVLLLLAIIGNTLVIIIVTISKKMKTTTNYYIVNLAIADLLVACFPMWAYVTTNITDGYILGAFFCKFNAFIQTSAMCAISFTMMAIAGDRFFAIVFPLRARVTQSKVKFVIAVVWLCAVSIGIPPLVFYTYTERRWANYVETFCADIWPMIERSDGTCDKGQVSERVYWTVIVAVLNWIPMLMMSINYTVIIHRLQFSRVAHNGNDSMSAVQRRSARRVSIVAFVFFFFSITSHLKSSIGHNLGCSVQFI
ncbi:substance-K receptor [Aplysia californica]|uniref:Substance-K receptor n=1 Tax=Aplysia californica TaxID=6500 RepID=A0ABM1VRI6_APLCA|nr:substance-K receptor [Aplysia californica]